MGEVKDAAWYDRIYAVSEEYGGHYKTSRYFVIWSQVLWFLRRMPAPKILEIGCGTGQFAHYLCEEGFRDYHGFDFSAEAIRQARAGPPMSFAVADARTEEPYRCEYNTAVLLEVLEHVEDDVEILGRLKPGTTVVFSLPNFDDESHVRHFTQPRAIVSRYERIVEFEEMVFVDRWFVCVGKIRGGAV